MIHRLSAFALCAALTLCVALAACRDGATDDYVAGGGASEADRYVDEGGPAMPYIAAGACPFECCTYGRWTATAPVTVYAREMDPATIAFEVDAGETLVADSGYVRVLRAGLVVADSAFTIYEGPTVAPGDTLYLLDTVGEGYEHAWYRDSVYEVSGEYWNWGMAPESAAADTFRARLVRPARTSWWVHVRDVHGRTGWLDMSAIPGGTFRGIDACG